GERPLYFRGMTAVGRDDSALLFRHPGESRGPGASGIYLASSVVYPGFRRNDVSGVERPRSENSLLRGDLCGLRRLRRRLVEAAILHDRERPLFVARNADIGQRIAVHQEEIGEIARLYLAELVAHLHDLPAELGRRDDGVHRREVEQLDEMLDIPRVRADRVPGEAVIAAGQDAHAPLLQLLHVLDAHLELALEVDGDGMVLVDAVAGTFPDGGRIHDAERR